MEIEKLQKLVCSLNKKKEYIVYIRVVKGLVLQKKA